MKREQETLEDLDSLIERLDAKPGSKPTKPRASSSKSKKVKDDPELLRAPMYRGHDIGFIRTVEEWDELIAKCQAAGICGFDIETTGKDAFKDTIHGFSLSWAAGCGRYVFWEFVEQHREKVAKDLATFAVVTQGGKFDFHFLKEHFPEYEPKIESDTMVQMHLEDPDQRHGLKENAWTKLHVRMMVLAECLGVDEADLEKDKVRIDFTCVPLDRLCQYGCGDADLTLQLYYYECQKIRPQYRKHEDVDTYVQVPVLVDMERRGLMVDKVYLEALAPMFERSLVRMEKNIHEVVGHPFDIASPKQVREVLYDEMKLTPLRLTDKTGVGSTAAEDLEKLAKSTDNDVLNWIVEYKHHQHSLSSFVRGTLNGASYKDGALHAEYMSCVVPTYRLACSGGNLGGGGMNVQQIPKDPELLEVELADEEREKLEKAGVEVKPTDKGTFTVTYNARRAFMAREGFYYVSADYQAIEFRIIINNAGEEEVGRAIRAGEDGHRRIASMLYRKPKEEITKAERDAIKALNYGLAYGMQPWGLKDRLNISEDLATELYNSYFRAMPRMQEYIKNVQRKAKRNGYVETYWGRQRNVEREFAFNYNRGARSSINTVIQGSAADVMRNALARTHAVMKEQFGNRVYLVATLHDQILFEVANDITLEEFVPYVRLGMERDRPEWLCPLVVDVSYGPNWGQLKDYGKKKQEVKNKKKRILLEALQTIPDDLVDEVNMIVESLPTGDMGFLLKLGNKEAEIAKVSLDKAAIQRIEESLGDYFSVRIEDVDEPIPSEPQNLN